MKKIVGYIIVLIFSFSFTSVVLAKDVNKISLDTLVTTINQGNVTKKIKELSKDSDFKIIANKTSDGLEIIIDGTNPAGYVGIEDDSVILYNSSSNTLTYTCYDGCVATSSSDDDDDFAYTEKDILNYLELWIYEASSYSNSKLYDSISKFKYFYDSNVCDLTTVGACIKNNTTDTEAKDFTYELSDKIALYINENVLGGNEDDDSSVTTGDSVSLTSESSTSSNYDKVSLTSEETQKTDIKNPDTGAFLNFGISALLIASSIGIIYIIRNKSKFYRI